MSPHARWATRLPDGVRTLGGRLDVVAAGLGAPLIPWQREAARLILAIDPDNPTRWRYPLIVITLPRQSGKSWLLHAVHLDRLESPNPNLSPPRIPRRIFMTAQTGQDARARWNDLCLRVETSSVYGGRLKRRASVGSEGLTLGPMTLRPFPPIPTALHGETTPFVSIDEAWAFDDVQSTALMAAVSPAMQNERAKQTIIISTAGTTQSRWLWSLIKQGRESVADPLSSMAYIEYSADPDMDPDDPRVLDYHPGIGQVCTREDIAALRPTVTRESWRRSFLNLWPDDMDQAAAARDMRQFDAAVGTDVTRPGRYVVAYAVACDRSRSGVWAAWPTPTGVHTALVASGPGTGWVPDTLASLSPDIVLADTIGYTGVVSQALAERGIPTTPVGTKGWAAASAAWLAGIEDGTISHDPHDPLRDQHATARVCQVAGSFALDARRDPIPDLQAAAIAAHAATPHTATTPGIYY